MDSHVFWKSAPVPYLKAELFWVIITIFFQKRIRIEAIKWYGICYTGNFFQYFNTINAVREPHLDSDPTPDQESDPAPHLKALDWQHCL